MRVGNEIRRGNTHTKTQSGETILLLRTFTSHQPTTLIGVHLILKTKNLSAEWQKVQRKGLVYCGHFCFDSTRTHTRANFLCGLHFEPKLGTCKALCFFSAFSSENLFVRGNAAG